MRLSVAALLLFPLALTLGCTGDTSAPPSPAADESPTPTLAVAPATPTASRTATPSPTATPAAPATPTATITAVIEVTPTPTAAPLAMPTPDPSPTPTVAPTPEPTPTPVPGPPSGRYTALTVGGGHACALTEAGEAVCWGSNDHGESDVPSGRYLAISAGTVTTCAVRADAELVCWGREMSELPPPGRYRTVSTNGVHACALTEDGEAVCWAGWNEFGEIEPPPGRYVAISVGRRLAEGPHPANSCALAADGAVVCWGWSRAKATDGGEAQHLDGHPALRFEGPYSSVVSPAGTGFCAVSVDGEAECWSDWPVSGDAPTPFEDLPKATTVADSDNDVRYMNRPGNVGGSNV